MTDEQMEQIRRTFRDMTPDERREASREAEVAELKEMRNLAPGDFRTVRQELFYLGDNEPKTTGVFRSIG